MKILVSGYFCGKLTLSLSKGEGSRIALLPNVSANTQSKLSQDCMMVDLAQMLIDKGYAVPLTERDAYTGNGDLSEYFKVKYASYFYHNALKTKYDC